MKIYSLLVALLFFASFANADPIDFISFGGEGELYIPVPIENAIADGNRLRIRSVELTGQADFDDWQPGLAGKLTLGAEDVSGDLIFNIREAYVVASDLGLKGLDLRAGKFYLPIGILNQQRRSAWSFISAPRAITLFFTDNGVVDTGADLTYHVGHFQLRAGATNGYRYDNSIQNGGVRPETPTNFARPEISFHLGNTELVIAGDYLGRVDDQGEVLRIAGLDASLTPIDEQPTSWHAQTELYHRYQNAQQGLAIVEDIGGYVFAEKGLNRALSAGLRVDAFKTPTLTDQFGQNRKNLTFAFAPVFTYRGRDHMRLQGSYTYLNETRDGDASRVEQTFELRFVAEFGDLPRSRTPEPDRSSL